MKLTTFIQDLLEKGEVTVAGRILPFEEEDLREAETLLRYYYEEDALEMPGTAPEFSPEAALWGAQYLYYAVQLTLLRDLGEEAVTEYLQELKGPLTPPVIYSVDLVFRYLPDLLHLAKGLAPGDHLVVHLRNTALQWPFSSVGLALTGEPDHQPILQHASLTGAYVDRIIQARDKTRVNNNQVIEAIRQVLGQYGRVLWPDFEKLIEERQFLTGK